jgi:hypothetical protein
MSQDLRTLPDESRISTSQVAALFGRSKASIFRWISIGVLPPTQCIPAGTRATHRLGDVRALLDSAGAKPTNNGNGRARTTIA